MGMEYRMAMIHEDWCPVLVECRMRILKSGGNTDICLFALNWLECVGMNYQTHSNLVQGFCFFCRSLSHPSGQRGVLRLYAAEFYTEGISSA